MSQLTSPPTVPPSADWRFPSPRERVLHNGIRVLAYDCPGQYVVAASLLFDTPLEVEPRDKEGVGGLVGRCLTRGAAGRNADEFADALAVHGADLEGAASIDSFAVRLSVPSTHLEAGLGLLADAAIRPDFAEEEIEHERSLRLEEIDQARAYPQQVAAERLNGLMFGDTRQGRLVGGDTETVAAVTRDDVVAHATSQLRPDNATLILAGDFHAVDPVALADSALGAWSRPGGADESRVVPRLPTNPSIVLVDWPDAPQTTLRLAGAGVTRSDERWPALFVANHAVGGSFSSRLNTVLREEKGLTYGASTSLDASRLAGLIVMGTAVRGDAGAEALDDALRIMREARGHITADEVATGVRAATESAALGFERADAVVGRVELLLSHRLPLDHVDVNLARLRAVTSDQANAAYTEVVDAEALTVVVVGDADQLCESLVALDYAPVTEVSPTRR